MDVDTAKALKHPKSQMISTLVSPAIGLWLRSQVERVQSLQFQLLGGDRQILTGHIPRVSITASQAVYQGLHLSDLQLEGTDIRFNLGQVFKGKPLRLLAPIPVVGQLLLTEQDLQASLAAPLLSNALNELVNTFLASEGQIDWSDPLNPPGIQWQEITIDTGKLTLRGVLAGTAIAPIPIVLLAGLERLSLRELQLKPLQIYFDPNQLPIDLECFTLDLGSEVHLEELSLRPGQLRCSGRLTVIP